MSDDSNVSADGPSEYQGVERRQNDRCRDLRFPFTAFVGAVENQSNAKIRGRTSDISSGGCRVETISPFPDETIIKIRQTEERVIFEANAKVVLSQVECFSYFTGWNLSAGFQPPAWALELLR
jgi:c-di-GMP-binding flagellar brake protein YcgR